MVLIFFKFILTVLGWAICMVVGSLFVKHKKVIEYCKRFFTSIRSDFQSSDDKNNEIDKTFNLLGGLLIILGFLGIIIAFSETITVLI